MQKRILVTPTPVTQTSLSIAGSCSGSYFRSLQSSLQPWPPHGGARLLQTEP